MGKSCGYLGKDILGERKSRRRVWPEQSKGKVGGDGSYNAANEHISVFHFPQMFSSFHMSAACSSIQFGIANLRVAFDGGHVYPLYLSLVFMPGIQSGIVLEERGGEREEKIGKSVCA